MNAPFYVVQFRTRCGCTREIQFDKRPPEVWRLPMAVDPHVLRSSLEEPRRGLYREFRFVREEPMSPPWETGARLWRLIYEEVGTYE
jgi:hypothetical protein